MLYQFTDSSCKEAVLSVDLSQRLSSVQEVDLKDDEKFVMQADFQDGHSVQLSFETRDGMKRWLGAVQLVLFSAQVRGRETWLGWWEAGLFCPIWTV